MARSVTICDPIHKVIELDPVCAAIVDHVAFQRLRYIRQNGLLHMIWPGAVHTRFAHSLGTMHMAQRVFKTIFHGLDESEALLYLRHAFVAAALLHDVGHCAFSHQIEHVDCENKPFLGYLGERLGNDNWNIQTFFEAHLRKRLEPEDAVEGWENTWPIDHELLGAFIVLKMFDNEENEALDEVCTRELLIEAPTFGQDVNCLRGYANPSEALITHLNALRDNCAALCADANSEWFGEIDKDNDDFAHDVVGALVGLISGTLDVDRLDYLQRDAHYCGVPYGQPGAEMLIRNLRVGGVAGRFAVGLKRKAVHCFEDMLWSRYQMFVQVYGHKTNVGINHFLAEAVGQAVEQRLLRPPSSYTDYLLLTDDNVMAAVWNVVINLGLQDTTYGRALVLRRFPRWLNRRADLTDEQVQEELASLAAAHGVGTDALFVTKTTSHFVKGKAIPVMIERDGNTTAALDHFSTGPVPLSRTHFDFFRSTP